MSETVDLTRDSEPITRDKMLVVLRENPDAEKALLTEEQVEFFYDEMRKAKQPMGHTIKTPEHWRGIRIEVTR